MIYSYCSFHLWTPPHTQFCLCNNIYIYLTLLDVPRGIPSIWWTIVSTVWFQMWQRAVINHCAVTEPVCFHDFAPVCAFVYFGSFSVFLFIYVHQQSHPIYSKRNYSGYASSTTGTAVFLVLFFPKCSVMTSAMSFSLRSPGCISGDTEDS